MKIAYWTNLEPKQAERFNSIAVHKSAVNWNSSPTDKSSCTVGFGTTSDLSSKHRICRNIGENSRHKVIIKNSKESEITAIHSLHRERLIGEFSLSEFALQRSVAAPLRVERARFSSREQNLRSFGIALSDQDPIVGESYARGEA